MTLPLDYTEPEWEIWLQRYEGTNLHALTPYVLSAELLVGLNSLGSFSLKLSRPGLAELGYNDLPLDSLIEFRYKHGAVRNFSFFKRKIEREKDTLVISGYGPNRLLLGRDTSAYYAGTSFTTKTDYLDDMMREVVSENCTSAAVDRDTGAAVTARDYNQIPGFTFALAPENSGAPSETVSFHGENVFDILVKLGKISAAAGTRLFFDTIRTGANSFEFRTYTDNYGVDRRGLRTFGEAQGNLTDTRVTYDHSQEVNFLYVAGQGPGESRVYEEVEDTDAEATSPLNRMEGFRDARNTPTGNLTQAGYQALQENKALRLFSGKLLDTEGARFGIDWDLGDLLDAKDGDEEFEIMVTGLKLNLSGAKQQSIEGFFEVIG